MAVMVSGYLLRLSVAPHQPPSFRNSTLYRHSGLQLPSDQYVAHFWENNGGILESFPKWTSMLDFIFRAYLTLSVAFTMTYTIQHASDVSISPATSTLGNM